jgi:hypothetical protein
MRDWRGSGLFGLCDRRRCLDCMPKDPVNTELLL